MFLFESIPWYSAVAGVTVTLALILLNEISRRSKLAAGFCFLILPILLNILLSTKTFFVCWFNSCLFC